MQSTGSRVVQGQQHVVIGRREVTPLKVQSDCGQSCSNFARPRGSLPIVCGGLALDKRVLSMAGASGDALHTMHLVRGWEPLNVARAADAAAEDTFGLSRHLQRHRGQVLSSPVLFLCCAHTRRHSS